MFTTILVQPLANGLILFYNLLFHNLGLAIIGFSLFLIVALRPLTKPYMDSMQKMRKLAPQLAKLKEKHKEDKVKMAQAQSELYKQNGVNPAAGCLPYLLQIVILIAFFNLFTQTLSKGGDITANFNTLLYAPLQFVDGQTIHTTFLLWDLAKPDVFQVGLPFALPGFLLIAAAAAQFVSAKAMASLTQANVDVAKKTKSETDDMAASMQKSMTYTFPLITLIVGLNFPSGLALYWLVFSLIQAYQQKNNNSLIPAFLKRSNLVESGK
jgi:YidC/Oxa1 family membrane protein insertase